MSAQEQLSAAYEALNSWPIEYSTVKPVSVSENATFRVDSKSDESYVLRLHRPGYQRRQALESEAEWTIALNAYGISSPVRIRTTAGNYFTPIQIGKQRRYAGLAHWVEGTVIGKVLEDQGNSEKVFQVYRQLGTLMARFHNQASSWTPSPNFDRPSMDEVGLMGMSPLWGAFWVTPYLHEQDRMKLLHLKDVYFQVLDDLPKSPDCYTLIHADLHPWNVLIHDDQLSVIDFDDAGFGWHAFDIAVALASHHDRVDYEHVLTHFLDGYREIRTITWPVEWIELFFYVRCLAHIGWISARPDLHGENPLGSTYALEDYYEKALKTAIQVEKTLHIDPSVLPQIVPST